MTVGYIEDDSAEGVVYLQSKGNMKSGQRSDHRRNAHSLQLGVLQLISGKPFHQIMCHNPVKQKGLNAKIVLCPKILQKQV